MHFIQLMVTWCVHTLATHTGQVCSRPSVCRKNNVNDFIPDRQPDFPDQKFETVTGDPFFVDENLLVKPSRSVTAPASVCPSHW